MPISKIAVTTILAGAGIALGVAGAPAANISPGAGAQNGPHGPWGNVPPLG